MPPPFTALEPMSVGLPTSTPAFQRTGEAGPCAGRGDVALVVQGVEDLMAMRSAGDVQLYDHFSRYRAS